MSSGRVAAACMVSVLVAPPLLAQTPKLDVVLARLSAYLADYEQRAA